MTESKCCGRCGPRESADERRLLTAASLAAMAAYPDSHCWDKHDAQVCRRAADLLAASPAAPAQDLAGFRVVVNADHPPGELSIRDGDGKEVGRVTGIGATAQAEPMLNGLTEAETNASASVAGLTAQARAEPAAPERYAVMEALRGALNKLPRYSFWLGEPTSVRKVTERYGAWIEWQAAHELFDAEVLDHLLGEPAALPQPAGLTKTVVREMLADTREVFDASGPETPQVVRDVIEYVASWLEVYADKRANGISAPSAKGGA